MEKLCKTCVWFICQDNAAIGSCAKFGDKDLIASQSAVFDDVEKTKTPIVDVGKNFGCIHWESEF